MNLDDATREQIDSLIQSNDVMLFMKGNRQTPQCGFSATVIQILNNLAPDYATTDVLADATLREGIKVYSSWPTVPQLYVKGEFVGGCDIIQELYGSGELHGMFGIELDLEFQPDITITSSAADALRQVVADAGSDGRELHMAVDAAYESTLAMAPRAPNAIEVHASGVTLLLDPLSAQRADGATIDAVETPRGTGFKIDNPNAPSSRTP